MEDLFERLPKVELHAHLSGSISPETLSGLLASQGHINDKQLPIIGKGNKCNILGAFDLFKTIHKALSSSELVERAAVEVVEEFAADGVIYLELRTTLRALPTFRDYLHAVVRGLTTAPSVLTERICVRLLVSIDRARGVDEARQTVDLAVEAAQSWSQLIVGVDLSGSPASGSLLDYVPMLKQARANGLKTTVHLAEIPDQGSEWLAFLRQHLPDRIGHGTYLPNSDEAESTDAVEARRLIVSAKIPLEICLTSNVKTKTVADYESHHLRQWLQRGHPLCLCTDDKGVFCSNLSDEFKLAVKHCELTNSEMFRVCQSAIEAAFCTDDIKSKLQEQLNAFKKEVLSQ